MNARKSKAKSKPRRVRTPLWPSANRVTRMKETEQNLLRRSSVDKALEKVTSLMSALGGEDSLLAHVFLTSDIHSIPVAYPKGFYRASNWEGRCLQENPMETGQAQLGHAYNGIIAAHNARTRSSAAVEFGVRVIVKEEEGPLVDAIFMACMTNGYAAVVNYPTPREACARSHSLTRPPADFTDTWT